MNGERIPYLIEKKELLTGKLLEDVEVKTQSNTRDSLFVSLQFSKKGGKKLAEVITSLKPDTDRLALAIVLDNVVQAAPVISQGIWNYAHNNNLVTRATIEGDFTEEQAKRLAVVLKSGALPVQIRITEISEIEKNTEETAFGEETVRATSLLVTPLFSWVENNYKGVLRFWGQEKIKEEYQEKRVSAEEGAHFKVQIKTKDKTDLLKENLRFVLEDNKEKRWESEEVEFSEIDKKQISLVPTYERNVDIWFSFSKDRRPNWSELTLYIIRTDIIGRDEVTWTFS